MSRTIISRRDTHEKSCDSTEAVDAIVGRDKETSTLRSMSGCGTGGGELKRKAVEG